MCQNLLYMDLVLHQKSQYLDCVPDFPPKRQLCTGLTLNLMIENKESVVIRIETHSGLFPYPSTLTSPIPLGLQNNTSAVFKTLLQNFFRQIVAVTSLNVKGQPLFEF